MMTYILHANSCRAMAKVGIDVCSDWLGDLVVEECSPGLPDRSTFAYRYRDREFDAAIVGGSGN
jgi:hypothetical protein